VRLLLTLAVLLLLVIPVIRELPLGQSSRSGLLAWLLVPLSVYWLWAGEGYRPLLLLQLLLFSTAATLLSAKVLLVIVDVRSLTVLRHAAWILLVIGAACAVMNLGAMLITLAQRRGQNRAG
jgi:hypothetical protein